jgi:hypothetical protein
MKSKSLVLLGDSILDNAPYTRREPDSTTLLSGMLPDWVVQRLALDGATMSGINDQLGDLEFRPSVAVLSIGGNDVTAHIGIPSARVYSHTAPMRE